MTDDATITDEATRVVLSYRSPDAEGTDRWPLADDDWVAQHLAVDTYATYLKRVHGGPIAVGEEFEEFVTRGCSRPRDVLLRVEAVDGGTELGAGTEIEFVARRDVLANGNEA